MVSIKRSISASGHQPGVRIGPSTTTRIPQVKIVNFGGNTLFYMYARVTIAVMREQISKLKEQLVKERHLR